MALKKGFYNEIFKKEEEWNDLISNNLLNYVYCRLELKPFYDNKLEELKHEYELSSNDILKQVIDMVEKIITELDSIDNNYIQGRRVDVNYLSNFFLTNQMNNLEVSKENQEEIKFEDVEEEKDDDYLYDY